MNTVPDSRSIQDPVTRIAAVRATLRYLRLSVYALVCAVYLFLRYVVVGSK